MDYTHSVAPYRYLIHYGIKGQKWGERRWQYEDGSLTPEGRIHYGVGEPRLHRINQRHAPAKKFKEYDKNQYNDDMDDGRIRKIAQMKLHNMTSKLSNDIHNFERDKESGLRVQKGQHDMWDDMESANPSRFKKVPGSMSNCVLSSIAYDLRRRGFDVSAKVSSSGYDDKDLMAVYKNPKAQRLEMPNPPRPMDNSDWVARKTNDFVKRADEIMNSQPEGSRGMIGFDWWDSLGGHQAAYEIKNGNCIVVDAQTGNAYPLSHYARYSQSMDFFRTDNLDVNYDVAKHAVV